MIVSQFPIFVLVQILFIITKVESTDVDAYRVVCYFPHWAKYRPGGWNFNVEHINPRLCTHIVFAYADITNDQYNQPTQLTFAQVNDGARYKALIQFKDQFPQLKIILAIGGTAYQSTLSSIASTEINRHRFAQNVVEFLDEFGFDGFDLGWQYPTASEKDLYLNLVKELRTSFENHDDKKLELSVVLHSQPDIADDIYDIPRISQYVDYASIYTMNFYTYNDGRTGLHSTLYSMDDLGITKSVDASVQYYLSKGANPSQLNIFIPTYGTTYALQNSTVSGIGAITTGPGQPGIFTKQQGSMAYFEICLKLHDQTFRWDEVYTNDEPPRGPYALNKTGNWVGYDNAASVIEKANYIKDHGLGGASIWDLSQDDFRGLCGGPRYPLVTALRDELEVCNSFVVESSDEPRAVCYLLGSSTYRANQWTYEIPEVPTSLCTHLVYAYGKLALDGQQQPTKITIGHVGDTDTQQYSDRYRELMRLKQNSPKLKILLAIGGDTLNANRLAMAAQTKINREMLANEIVQFLRLNSFDGIDILLQAPHSKDDFSLLLQEISVRFRRESCDTGRPSLLLATTVSGDVTFAANYDIDSIFRYSSFVNLQTYGYGRDGNERADLHTALSSQSTIGDVETSLQYYLDNGGQRDKINIGVSFYGRSYKLSNSSNTNPGSDADGPGSRGTFTANPGTLAYFEICGDVAADKLQEVWSSDHHTSYAFSRDGEWVSYDNSRAVQEKGIFIKNENLGGSMIWDLSVDDFRGYCLQGRYPLLTSLIKEIKENSSITIPTIPPTQEPGIYFNANHSSWNFARKVDRYRMVCYYPNWAQFRGEGWRFSIDQMDASHCTHLVFAFADLQEDDDGRVSRLGTTQWDDEDVYEKMVALKTTYPGLKNLIAVGGATVSTKKFMALTITEDNIKLFAKDLVDFLVRNEFDGIDLDWEFPEIEGRERFTLLVNVLREVFDKTERRTGRVFELSAAMSAWSHQAKNSYELDKIYGKLDYINLMAYDYRGPWSIPMYTGLHSGLYPSQNETTPFDRSLNVHNGVQYYLAQGVPPSMLNLGIPMYGKSFELADPDDYEVGAMALEAGARGYATLEPGTLAYFEICVDLLENGWRRYWSDDQLTPFAVSSENRYWVGYDDIESVTIKASYIKNMSLGGAMIWDASQDDFRNYCGDGKNPLISTISEVLSIDNTVTDPPLVIYNPISGAVRWNDFVICKSLLYIIAFCIMKLTVL